jgi:hypoxia up-regulated 1
MLRIHIILASLFAYASASLLAIDYGGEWIKASLIKPGVPFDVLLNRDSKRKIQSSVAWKGEDRMFGGDAFALVRDMLNAGRTRAKFHLLGITFPSRLLQRSQTCARSTNQG